MTLTNPFPDYVFDSAYRLATLENVERYIKAHHHLSDIPSADSVAANGIDLGSNQAALLKKIEELTLYLLQQNKELEALKGVDADLHEQNRTLQEQARLLQSQQERIDRLERLIGENTRK